MSEDFKDDELIEVKLPRSDYEILRIMLKEREAKNWIIAKLSSWWVFALGSGALVLYTLWERITLNGIGFK